MNLRIPIRPWESTSKMSQKPKLRGLVTFKKYSKFSVQSFGTLTHNCGKPVGRIKILTSASERGPRDLPLMVLWRYTNIVMIWVFMIPLNWWNRGLFRIRNHKSSFNNFYIISIFSNWGFTKKSNVQFAYYIKTVKRRFMVPDFEKTPISQI